MFGSESGGLHVDLCGVDKKMRSECFHAKPFSGEWMQLLNFLCSDCNSQNRGPSEAQLIQNTVSPVKG
jgi:hypothetical protein